MFDAEKASVRKQTPAAVNDRIDRETNDRVFYHATRPVDFVSHRILELDSERDVEWLLKVSLAGLGLISTGALFVARRGWLTIPILAISLLGGSTKNAAKPLLLAFRQIGVRTREEIELERTALLALRGDFGDLAPGGSDRERADAALRLARERSGPL
jgi:hypothetical protein